MFLKRISLRKNGKRHKYWALVKSVRTARGPRYQVVSYLGELEPGEKAGGPMCRESRSGRSTFNSICSATPVRAIPCRKR